jgi:hypothetical protein
MGPELFDYAFKEYSKRWAFKHPTPADFFRTMEDASAVDLDWFWNGWFYTTDNVDMEVADVTWYKLDNQINTESASINKDKLKKKRKGEESENIESKGYTADDTITPEDKLITPLPLKTSLSGADEITNKNQNFYEVKLRNKGGLVMPVILQFNYRDGSSEIKHLPAEIWRLNDEEVTKVFVLDKEIENVVLDPFKETADVEESNNHFPPKDIPSDFQKFKENEEE